MALKQKKSVNEEDRSTKIHEKNCKLNEANIPQSSVLTSNCRDKYLNYRDQVYPTTIHFPEKTFLQ